MKNLIPTLAVLLLAAGCTNIYKTDRIEEPMLPVSTFELPRKEFLPTSLKFRLAVINMVDQTGSAGNLVKTIPDVLTTGLFDTARFDLLDRGQLREKRENDLDQALETMKPDGLLQGAITQIRPSDKVIICDIRVINRKTHAVMYAKSAEMRFTGSLEVQMNRDDINRLSQEIADSFPKMDERQPVKILDISSDTVTISVGTDRGIKSGMAALVYSGGDLTRDLDTSEVLSSVTYLAQVNVTSVLDRMSKATIESGGGLRVGDLVTFK